MSDPTTIEAIFAAALERPPDARGAYLDDACGADEGVRRRVERLLRAHGRAGGFLERPIEAVDGPSGRSAQGRPLEFLDPPGRPDSLGRLGPFEVLEIVGEGGAGLVLRAFDAKLHRIVAIKVMAGSFSALGPARRRFVREARAAASVIHENVVAIHAVDDDGPVPYLVMAFVDGPTLQQKIDREGPLPLVEILRIGKQVAAGLAAAHAQGLVHRDVKPANILLENGVERLKITDFGLARAVDDPGLTHQGQVAGTPAYMAPEQAAGGKVDARGDLFSLGSVLYAMCAGQPPFRGESVLAVLRRVCDDTPRPVRRLNPEIPAWLEALIAQLHARDPARRPASAAEVAEALGRRLAELREGGPGQAGPHARGPLRAALLLAVVGLGLAEAGGITDLRGALARWLSPAGGADRGGRPGRLGDEAPADGAEAWERRVAALPPADQVREVAARLRRLNPGFAGRLVPKVVAGRVEQIDMLTDDVTDLSPLRAFAGLKTLWCGGTPYRRGRLADLGPLRGMRLEWLNVAHTRVADLTPLRGMPLRRLMVNYTGVADLEAIRGLPLEFLHAEHLATLEDLGPLRGMPLRDLNLCNAGPIRDLGPLAGMPLESLNLTGCRLHDISPLAGLPTLRNLCLDETGVADLGPLRDLPLTGLSLLGLPSADLEPLRGKAIREIRLDDRPDRASLLRSLRGLARINYLSAREFWDAHPSW